MKPKTSVFVIFYLSAFILDAIIAVSDDKIRYLSKGILIPLLIAFFVTEVKAYVNSTNKQYIRLVCLALVFSFLGDIFLIGKSSLNFILGIAVFLIAQVFYIILFTSIQPFRRSYILFLSVAAFIILCYLFALNYLFWPKVNEQHFVIPVLAYSFVLGLMLFTSINTFNEKQLSKTNKFYFIAGAVLFVASDSMIGLNSFYLPMPLPGFYIMSTYCLAQFLLVSGAIKFIRGKQSTNH